MSRVAPAWRSAVLAAFVLCALLPAAALADGFFSQFKERLGLSPSNQPFLPVGEAFAFSAEAGSDRIVLRWRVADGYYLYRDRMSFGPAEAAYLGPPQLPAAHAIKEDEFFGRMAVYTEDVEVVIPVVRQGAGPVRVEATWQGCAEAGFCYPPESKAVEFDLPPA